MMLAFLIGGIVLFAVWYSVSEASSSVYWRRGGKTDPRDLQRDDLLERARVAERNQLYGDAITCYREVLAQGLSPQPERIWFRIGVLAQEFERDYPLAYQAFRRAAEILGERTPPAEGEADEEGASLRRECETREADVAGRLRDRGRGDLARRAEVMKLVEDGRIQEARVRVERMHEDAPGDAENTFLKGYVTCRLGSYWLGVDLYRRALELDPAHHRAAYNLAAALDVLEQEDEALAAYERYLEGAADAADEREWLDQARLQCDRLRQEVAGNRIDTGEA
jgi:tetratricopeptide (TPR) repeat protein